MTEPPARRFRPRLSLRALMIVVLLVGGGLGWYVASARHQAETVAVLRHLGGNVWYDWEYRDGEFAPGSEACPWPDWMMKRLGPDYLGSVTAVSLKGSLDEYDPGIIDRLRALPRLEFLGSIDFPSQAEIRLLSQIESLKRVDIMIFKGSPKDLRPITKLKRLESLHLFPDSIDELNLAFLSDLKMLRKFSLTADQIPESALAPLRNLKNLEELEIDWEPSLSGDEEPTPLSGEEQPDLKLTSRCLALLAGMKQLKCLKISDIQINDLAKIGQMTSLRELSLDEGELDDAGFAPIAGLHDLESLSIPEGKITDQGLAALAKLTRLKKLHLSSKAITDSGLVHLAGLTSLEELGLLSDKITDQGLVTISKFSKLKVLSLSDSKITDVGVTLIARLSKLEELSIGSASLTDAAIVPLAQLTRCQLMRIPVGVGPDRVSPNAFAQLKARLPTTTFNPSFGVAHGMMQ